METTTNYKLPQWVKADQIKMDDFNDAFGKIDTQMKKNADKANAAASAKTPIRGFAWRLFPGIWSKPCCWPFPAYCC